MVLFDLFLFLVFHFGMIDHHKIIIGSIWTIFACISFLIAAFMALVTLQTAYVGIPFATIDALKVTGVVVGII